MCDTRTVWYHRLAIICCQHNILSLDLNGSDGPNYRVSSQHWGRSLIFPTSRSHRGVYELDEALLLVPAFPDTLSAVSPTPFIYADSPPVKA